VWLDRGELDKLIERSMQEASSQAEAPVPQHHRTPHPAPRYDKPYKKKSFWHEIFD
jgi:Zn-finger nucleic acid-binding protein